MDFFISLGVAQTCLMIHQKYAHASYLEALAAFS